MSDKLQFVVDLEQEFSGLFMIRGSLSEGNDKLKFIGHSESLDKTELTEVNSEQNEGALSNKNRTGTSRHQCVFMDGGCGMFVGM